jgi:hypothetical protein
VPTGIDLDRLYGRFLERYTADPARRSTVHEGVVPAPRALAARGMRLGVCTNKAQAPTEPNLGARTDVSAPAMVAAHQTFDSRPLELMGGVNSPRGNGQKRHGRISRQSTAGQWSDAEKPSFLRLEPRPSLEKQFQPVPSWRSEIGSDARMLPSGRISGSPMATTATVSACRPFSPGAAPPETTAFSAAKLKVLVGTKRACWCRARKLDPDHRSGASCRTTVWRLSGRCHRRLVHPLHPDLGRGGPSFSRSRTDVALLRHILAATYRIPMLGHAGPPATRTAQTLPSEHG